MTPKLGTAELLFRCAADMGLQPAWITPDGLFAVSIAGREKYINYARSPLNSDLSVSLVKNKYMARLILDRNGVDNIPYLRTARIDAAEEFLRTHTAIIAKPLTGSGARDIHYITDAMQLQALALDDYILEKYITGREMRYLVLDGAVVGVHESKYGTSVDEHRHLERVSYPYSIWDESLIESSLHIASIMDLRFAAVDYLIDVHDQAHVLEINTLPGLKWFHAPTAGPIVDVARLFLESYIAHNLPFESPRLIAESR